VGTIRVSCDKKFNLTVDIAGAASPAPANFGQWGAVELVGPNRFLAVAVMPPREPPYAVAISIIATDQFCVRVIAPVVNGAGFDRFKKFVAELYDRIIDWTPTPFVLGLALGDKSLQLLWCHRFWVGYLRHVPQVIRDLRGNRAGAERATWILTRPLLGAFSEVSGRHPGYPGGLPASQPGLPNISSRPDEGLARRSARQGHGWP